MAYYFPRVNTSFTAMTRTPAIRPESTATILFAPITSSKGPENVLTYVRTLAEFREIFGDVRYQDQGQQVLNVCRWLNAGGEAAVCRINAGDTKTEVGKAAEGLGLAIIENTGDDAEQTYYHSIIFTINDCPTKIKSGIKLINSKIKISAEEEPPKYEYKLSISIPENLQFPKVEDGHLVPVSGELIVTTDIKLSEGENPYDYIESLSTYDYTSIEKSDGEFDRSKKLILIKREKDGTTSYIRTDIKIKLPEVTIDDVKDNNISIKRFKINKNDSGIDAPVAGEKAKYGEDPVSITAKYSGSFYNSVRVVIKPVIKSYKEEENVKFSVTVLANDIPVESMSNLNKDTLYRFNNASNYVVIDSNVKFNKNYLKNQYSCPLAGGTDCVVSETSLITTIRKVLENPLETPVDVMLDAGYSDNVKKELLRFFCGTEPGIREARNDVTVFLDSYVVNHVTNVVTNSALTFPRSENGVEFDYFNASLCSQYGKTEDIYSNNEDIKEIYVTPTYAYARLIPYNDAIYGIQTPEAGISYGKVTEFNWINSTPSDNEKNRYYAEHINYIEKDSRGYAFMNQQSKTSKDTDLDRVNNGRVLNRMRRDIQRMARPYLYQVLDATTLASLNNRLNAYAEGWKQNRVLSFYNIEVSADEYNLNQINVSLRIKFSRLTEIINVDIVVL